MPGAQWGLNTYHGPNPRVTINCATCRQGIGRAEILVQRRFGHTNYKCAEIAGKLQDGIETWFGSTNWRAHQVSHLGGELGLQNSAMTEDRCVKNLDMAAAGAFGIPKHESHAI